MTASNLYELFWSTLCYSTLQYDDKINDYWPNRFLYDHFLLVQHGLAVCSRVPFNRLRVIPPAVVIQTILGIFLKPKN